MEVEQELISEGLPETEVLKLCDIHGEVLEGHVDQSGAKEIPVGHPIDVFIQENKAIDLLESIPKVPEGNFNNFKLVLLSCFNDLMDIDKHYQRKEYLGTLEVSQDIKNTRELEGERRILSYRANNNEPDE